MPAAGMDQTFMTIHNLGPEANILFASESITDILGYRPAEVQGRSCFDYFHPDEVPFARSVHSRGVLLDKAAVLHYARILSQDGRWIGCECCFTIVHDVLVACTSIYRRGVKSERRAIEAPQIRRIFSCSPRDPRYHMLEHLSPKFKMSPTEREPRAALFLNRFTRNLTIMFATTSITSVLGLRPHEIKNRGFYRCIQESSLAEAIECLESAKANDSIAYLRFFFQDPREDGNFETAAANNNNRNSNTAVGRAGGNTTRKEKSRGRSYRDAPNSTLFDTERTGSHKMNDDKDDMQDCMPGVPVPSQGPNSASSSRLPSIELEAVVSCTSDGLVVILRKARPPIPPAHPPLTAFDYRNGLFAAPWGEQPIRPLLPNESLYAFQSPLLPQYMPRRDNVKDAGGPPLDILMNSIRDVAVFAWGVVGINPAMAAYGNGLPKGEAWPSCRVQRSSHHPRPSASAGDGGSSSNDISLPPSAANTSSCNERNALERTFSAAQSKEYSSNQSLSHASYNALDPVAKSTSSSPCGLQSAWPDPSSWNRDSAHFHPHAAAAVSRHGTPKLQQVPNSCSAPTLYPSTSRPPSTVGDVMCQSGGRSPPASRNTLSNASTSVRAQRNDWQ